MVIGPGGAGKSTVARQIARRTGLPLIHLDVEYWQPGWKPVSATVWAARVVELAAGDRWVMDGDFEDTLSARLGRADTVVFLDVGRVRCTWRAIRRRVVDRGKSRADLPEGCREGFDLAFYRWIWTYPRARRLAMLAGAADRGVRVVVVRNAGQARCFVDGLADEAPLAVG